MHVVLLGDSTLDNGLYTDGGSSVMDHLKSRFGFETTVTLLAVDGDQTWNVADRLGALPPTTTHLVLSVEGNDALNEIDVLRRPATSVADALSQFTQVLDGFDRSYRKCLDRVLERNLPTVVCTIYNGAFADPSEQRVVSTAVRLFDDVIMQAAFDAGCPVVDLRRVCNEPSHFWDPIEPNEAGGKRIANAIAAVLASEWSSVSTVTPSGRHAL